MTVSSTPTGTTFARFSKALAIARGNLIDAEGFAAGQAWWDTPHVVPSLKAAVSAVSTEDFQVANAPIAFDLAQYLRPLTLIGKLQGSLRRVPFRTRVLIGTTGARGSWVEEGQPIPVSSLGYELGGMLDVRKVGTIAVLTQELVMNARPAADATIAAEIGRAIVAKLDEAFIDPAYAGSAGVSPASVTNGATQLMSSGSTVAAIDLDLEAMIAVLVASEMPLTTAVFVMSPITASHLSLKRGTGGAPAYPLITAKGGFLAGIQVLTSTACAAEGSPGERFIALIEAGEIMLADDGDGEISSSQNASLQMTDTPSSGPQAMTSLWSANLVAIKATRHVNWQVRRAGASVVLREVAF